MAINHDSEKVFDQGGCRAASPVPFGGSGVIRYSEGFRPFQTRRRWDKRVNTTAAVHCRSFLKGFRVERQVQG